MLSLWKFFVDVFSYFLLNIQKASQPLFKHIVQLEAVHALIIRKGQ